LGVTTLEFGMDNRFEGVRLRKVRGALGVGARNGGLVARPTREKYTLDELRKEHQEFLKILERDDEWLRSPTVGRELI
jgi:hypothetical protein